MSGTCPAGTAISYKVNDTTTKDFYVLKDNGNTLTLITKDNVVANTKWNETGNNADGPITANAALVSATSGWNTTTRMLTKEESESVGCTTVDGSCPRWLFGENQWTSTPVLPAMTGAFRITVSGKLMDHYVTYNSDNPGVKAVININK